MSAKSGQLQIRVTPEQKAELKALAARAGMDVSTFVLSRALPAVESRVAALISALEDDAQRKFALAGLGDILNGLSPAAFVNMVHNLHLDGLSEHLQNYVSAMIEHAAHQKGVSPPLWTSAVEPLESPYFAVPFPKLRPHLLRAAPVAFKRRNLFVDATLGDRV